MLAAVCRVPDRSTTSFFLSMHVVQLLPNVTPAWLWHPLCLFALRWVVHFLQVYCFQLKGPV